MFFEDDAAAAARRAGSGAEGVSADVSSAALPPNHWALLIIEAAPPTAVRMPLDFDGNRHRTFGLPGAAHPRMPLLRVPAAELAAFAHLHTLSLADNAIETLQGLEPLAGLPLRRLNVARNRLHDLAGAGALRTLQELDASGNLLTTPCAEELCRLPALRWLDLSGNQVTVLHDVEELQRCSRLAWLSLVANPVVQDPFYRRVLLRALPKLTALDGVDVRCAC